MPIIKGALVSSVVLMMFGVLSPNEAYESIHWQVIILIAALIPLGIVIQSSGTAAYIANAITNYVDNFSDDSKPYVLFALIYFLGGHLK